MLPGNIFELIGADPYDILVGGAVTADQCEQALADDIASAKEIAAEVFAGMQCAAATSVAEAIVYELGQNDLDFLSGLDHFPKFVGYMRAGDWADAATGFQASAWCNSNAV